MEALSWSGADDRRVVAVTFDRELEEYRLLAFLQRVDAQYRARKLYPCLDDLDRRIGRLRSVVNRAGTMNKQFPGEVLGLDLQHQELLRAPHPGTGPWDLVQRALDRTLQPLVEARQRGVDLREELNGLIHVEPVGVTPLDAREGWLLLRQRNEASIYAYSMPLVREANPTDRYRLVRTHYFATWTLGLSFTYEHVKAELVRIGPLPNPATFAFEADITMPRIETFLPLAKRITYELVSTATD